MKIKNLILLALVSTAFAARAENFNSVNASGNIVSANGFIRTNNGFLYSSSYVQAAGAVSAGSYVAAGTFMNAITSISAGSFISAVGEGYFGNFLRIGGNTNTPAAKSVQIGPNAKATSYGSLVVGQYNVEEGTSGSWQFDTPTVKEPLLVAGNGIDANNKRNAFAVYKDGTVTMSKAQGDISMGQFGN